MPANTIYVGRPSQWGNPFAIDGHLTRDDCVEAYRRLLMCDYDWFRRRGLGWTAAMWFSVFADHDRQKTIATWVSILRGKHLACWCPLDAPCHADVLLEIANDGEG